MCWQSTRIAAFPDGKSIVRQEPVTYCFSRRFTSPARVEWYPFEPRIRPTYTCVSYKPDMLLLCLFEGHTHYFATGLVVGRVNVRPPTPTALRQQSSIPPLRRRLASATRLAEKFFNEKPHSFPLLTKNLNKTGKGKTFNKEERVTHTHLLARYSDQDAGPGAAEPPVNPDVVV